MKNNLEIVFLGGLFPRNIYKDIYSKSKYGMQNAANNFQWNIVEGLDANLENPINIMNLMFVGSYPKKYKDVFIKSFSFSHCYEAKDFNIGFFNLTGLKHFFLHYSCKKNVENWAINYNNKTKVLIIYSMQPYFLEAAKYVKKLNDNVYICLIVPDLPIYMCMDAKKRSLLSFYKWYQNNKIFKSINSIDSFVFLTEAMPRYLKITKPYIIIEGIASKTNDSYYEDYICDNFKTILYAGTLTRKYGVLDLVNAFRSITKKYYRLIICGDGETKNDIIKASNEDSRIVYKGLLPNKEVKKLQKQATILVNPRKNNEEYTRYSFPSKLIEYMSSGRPVVCYKLDGVPNEYDNYLYYVKGCKSEDLAYKIEHVLSKNETELSNFGKKARQYVFEEKNKLVQGAKILKMIEKDINI